MLDSLEQVDWQTLNTFWGSATEIPDLIRQIVSDDPVRAETALEELQNVVEHQGSVLEVTIVAAPFLMEALKHALPEVRVAILDFVSYLASLWPLERDWRRLSPTSVSIGGETEDNRESSGRKFQVYEAISDQLDFVLRLLQDADSRIRRGSMKILGLMVEWTMSLLPSILDYIEKENDRNTRLAAIWYTANLISSSETPQKELTNFSMRFVELIGQTVSVIRDDISELDAAIAMAKVLQTSAPHEIDVRLLKALQQLSKYPGTPWESPTKNILTDVCNSLLKLGVDRAVPQLIEALCTVPELDDVQWVASALMTATIDRSTEHRLPFIRISYGIGADMVLERTYDRGFTAKPVETLTADQESAIRAIVNCERFWEVRNNMLNVYGLPDSRMGLQELLAGSL